MRIAVLWALFGGSAWAQGIDIRAFGVTGDGIADDTAALDQAFRQVSDHSQINVPAGLKLRITGTVTIAGKSGLKVTGLTGGGNAAGPGTGAPQVLWAGPRGGVMLRIDKTDGLVMEGLALFPRLSCRPEPQTEAGVAIDIDQSSPNPGGITTDIILRRIHVSRCGSNTPDFVAVRFSHSSMDNVEHIRVEDSTFYCAGSGPAGTALHMGHSANAKNYKFARNSISNCEYGIHTLNGSFEASGNLFNSNRVDIFSAGYVDTLNIQGNVTENSEQFFVGVGIWPVELSNNKIATVNTPPQRAMVEVTHAYLIAKGNKFDQSDLFPAFRGAGGAALLSLGNEYPNRTYESTGWSTFEAGVVTLQDKLIDPATNAARPTGIMMSGAEAAVPVPMKGVGLLYYDARSKKWKVSEDGQPFVDLVRD
ncbi:MAG: hypothetical protein R2762_12455 [Bryobacteraceae bacterium]